MTKRQHDYSAPIDYGQHIDTELEKTNAKVLAETWKRTPRSSNESDTEHLRRVNREYLLSKKQRNTYGRIT